MENMAGKDVKKTTTTKNATVMTTTSGRKVIKMFTAPIGFPDNIVKTKKKKFCKKKYKATK